MRKCKNKEDVCAFVTAGELHKNALNFAVPENNVSRTN